MYRGLQFSFSSFGGKEGIGFRFHVLRSRERFRRYRGRRVSISCFALRDSFLAVPGASGPVFIFCVPDLIFDGTEGVGSRFHILRSRTRFRRYRGPRLPFSCFAHPGTFSAIRRASSRDFIFCASGLIFGGTDGIYSRFHVLPARTSFRRYRGRQVLFSYFCAPELISCGTEGAGSRFHVLRALTRFQRYRGRRFPFSSFARSA
jgi:hypothetical protein